MSANDRQEGGDHYRKHGASGEQHWDRIIRLYPESFHVYFVAAVTKYCERYRDKNGIEDLKKARHYLDKLIEAEEARAAVTPGTHRKPLPENTVTIVADGWCGCVSTDVCPIGKVGNERCSTMELMSCGIKTVRANEP